MKPPKVVEQESFNKSQTTCKEMHLHSTLMLSILASRKQSRCGQCKGCKQPNCGTCSECRDMKEFGGPGRKKKACSSRKCDMQSAITNLDATISKLTSLVHGTGVCLLLTSSE